MLHHETMNKILANLISQYIFFSFK